ncbi:unnamed protein product, partial [marine sediment metagenome]
LAISYKPFEKMRTDEARSASYKNRQGSALLSKDLPSTRSVAKQSLTLKRQMRALSYK